MADSELIVNFIGKDKSLSSVANKLGKPFQQLGGVVKAGAAIAGTALVGLGAVVVGAGAKLIGLGSDAEEMLGKFNVVFAETGGRVSDELGTFADAVGRSKFELMEMASTFGDTLKPMGFSEDAAAGFSVELTKLATDLGSFNNMEMDEALQRLQGTLIGSHENALAFGVIINENTLKAELARQGWDNLTGTQLEQAKVQARMNLLMAGTTDAQGDAARTSQSWANQIRGLKATITDWATEMGLKLLPVFTPLLEKLGELARNFLPVLQEKFEAIMPHLVNFGLIVSGFVANLQAGQSPLTAFINSIMGILPAELVMRVMDFRDNVLPGLQEKFQLLKDKIIEFVTPIGDWIASFFEWKDVLIALGIVVGVTLVAAIGSLIVSMAPIILTIGAIIAAVALVRQVWENDFLGIKTVLIDFWTNTGEPIFNTVKEWLQTNIPIAIDFLKNAWENVLLPAIVAVWTWLSTTLLPFITGVLVPWLQTNIPIAIDFLKSAWETVLLPAIQAVWTWLSETLIPFFTETLVPWLQENIPAAIEILRSFWEETLLPALDKVWEFLSVSMMPIWESLGNLFEVYLPFVLAVFSNIWTEGLLPAITSVYNFIKDNLLLELDNAGAKFEWLKTTIIDPVIASFGGLEGIIQSVAGWIDTLSGKLGGITLPDWMTPGSPMPWEIGLVGVRDQLRGLSRGEIPALSNSLQGLQKVSNDNRSVSITNNITTGRVDVPGLTQIGLQFANGGI